MAQTPLKLEVALRDLPRTATLVKDRGYRQVWRFEHDGRAYYLKFYPRPHGIFRRDTWRRIFRGSPAFREFERLQRLQKAAIPAPRAVAYLAGLRVADRLGDAVILEALEPSVQLDLYLNDHELRGEPVPDRLGLSERVRTLVHQLVKAKLGHEDLHLGNFLLHNGKVYLLDGYAVRPDGLTKEDLFRLAHSASRFATRTDLLRGWRLLGPEGVPPPTTNPVSNGVFRTFLERVTRENRYFGLLDIAGWRGVFFKHAKYPRPWSDVSQLNVTADDWRQAWPELLARVEADQLEVIKRSRSGDVLAGEIMLGVRSIAVVIKRPRRRYWYRYLNEIGRGRARRRAWIKAWKMIARNVPSAWPLLLMERRRVGYVVDTLIVFERVPGPTLAKVDLEPIPAARRDMLFRRVGRILRRIEYLGFSHFDAKASNWIVMPDAKRGETPVLIDIDGIRQRRWVALGIQRLLKSLRSHPQYTPEDSLALCQGYAPWTRMKREDDGVEGGESRVEGKDTQLSPPLPSTLHASPSTSPPPGGAMTPIPFPSPPRRILIIKPSAIGDVVHALPVLNLMRRRWPDAHVSWLVTPACAGLLERHRQVDEVIRFERHEFGRGWRSPRVAVELFRFMRSLRQRRFDLVVDLQGLFRSGWLAAATRAPVRVGPADAREGAWLFYTHRIPTGTAEQHAIERYLTVAQALGCERGPVEFHFAVDDSDRAAVSAMVPPGPYAVLMPGANWATKQWPVERFAALVEPIRARFGMASVVAGGPDVADLAAKIPGATNLAGRTDLRQLVALLERANLVVANDSGPMHIAAALGRPLVTPFGPTNPVRTGPYRREGSVVRLAIPCSPCYSRRCSHQSCLQWLTIDPVMELARQQVRSEVS